MGHKQITFAVLLAILFLFPWSGLIAQDNLPDSIAVERIQIIQDMLDKGRGKANAWWYGWIAGYGAATIAQGTVCLFSDKLATRQDLALGALTTLLGMGWQIIDPMTPGFASEMLKEYPDRSPEERSIKLQEAEKLLEASALREKDGRSWKIHVLDGAVNIGCGFIVWFGFKRTFTDGLINTAMNTAICEAQIFSQPTRAIKDYNKYCQLYKPDQMLSYEEPRMTWSFIMVPGGAGIRLGF